MFDFLDLKSRRAGITFTAFVAFSATLLFSGMADAKTVYVNGAIGKPGKGATWATAFKYLRDALDQTKSGDEIYVAKGIYYPDDGASGAFGDREMSFDLKGQKVYGGFAGTETNLSQRKPSTHITTLSGAIWGGANASDYWSLHVLTAEKNSTLDGVIVEDGHANGGHSWNYPDITAYDQGGGCYVKSGVTLTLANSIFRDNRALDDGGAIMVEDGKGKVIASNCTFERNEIRWDYNIITGNSAGGAINGDVDATDCKFISNTISVTHPFKGTVSSAFGGAISGKVKAVRCEFDSNWVYAHTYDEGVEPTADGGAVHGSFSGTNCIFTGNQAEIGGGQGTSSGGAISGTVVNAFNCTFLQNGSGTSIGEEGKIVEPEEGEEEPEEEPTLKAVRGGGGAIHMSGGESQIANCVFIGNTSLFRGGAVQAGVNTHGGDSIFISNSTFLDNGVPMDGRGAALSCGGIVRILNNIFWYTAPTAGSFDLSDPIHVSYNGALRNSDERYPTPSTAAPNILKGGDSTITQSEIPDIFLVSPSILILDADPLFANIADPDGADNRWGTTDDGLRLAAGSPAIGRLLDPRVSGFNNLLPKDINDIDRDNNVTERLPSDLAGFVRVQNGFVEMGAYEFGNLANVAEIAVSQGGKALSDGASRNFGSVRQRKKKELTFTIKSVGTNGLGNISIDLAGSKEFTLKKVGFQSLDPGKQVTFTVVFRPKKGGKYSTKLRIFSSDADESPFDITLTGKCLAKKSSGKKAGTKIPSLASTDFDPPTSTDPTAFLSAAGSSNVVTTTVIAADGTKHLVLTVLKSEGWTGGTVQVSSDLLEWYSGEKHTTVLEDSATLLRVRDNTPVTGGGKRYIRLK